MPIKHHAGGGSTVWGDSMNFFRLAAQRGAVGLELKGIKMTRGPVLWKSIREEYGITKKNGRPANKQEVYLWLCQRVEELRSQQEHIEPDGRRTVGGEEVQ